MFKRLNSWLGEKEAAEMAAKKPDEEDKPNITSTDLETWMKNVDGGETSNKSVEFLAGDLHEKVQSSENISHPHLELVVNNVDHSNNEAIHAAAVEKNPFAKEEDFETTTVKELFKKLEQARRTAEEAMEIARKSLADFNEIQIALDRLQIELAKTKIKRA